MTPVTLPPPRCHWNGTYYNEGDRFQKSPCSPFTCERNGQYHCAVVDCFFTRCINPVHDPTKCCPVCPDGPNCKVRNLTIPAGKAYQVDNTTCRCPDAPYLQGGRALCRISKFTTGCMHQGKLYPYGSFQPSDCKHCHCDHSGRVNCAIEDCFTMCVDAVHKPGTCCPVCPNGPNCFLGNKKIPANKDYHVGNQICRCPDGHQFGSVRNAVCTQLYP